MTTVLVIRRWRVGSVLAEVAPLALAIAASPFPVVPAILLLFTSRPRATAGAFLAGWATGILAACSLSVALASVVELAEETPTWAVWTKLALGAVLIVLAARQWLTRAEQKEPGWMRALEGATPGSALRLGLLLSAANPKILLLAGAGGLAIASADLAAQWTAAAVLAFTLLASCTVAVPLVSYAVLGDRVLAPLERARQWLRAHNATVVALVLAVIGVLLVVEAVASL